MSYLRDPTGPPEVLARILLSLSARGQRVYATESSLRPRESRTGYREEASNCNTQQVEKQEN